VSTPSTLFANRAEHPVALKLGSGPASGTDALGPWQADTYTGSAGGIRLEAAIRRYPARGAVTFDITLPDGANSTQREPFNTSVYGQPGQVPPMLDFPAFSWGGKPAPDASGTATSAPMAELGVFNLSSLSDDVVFSYYVEGLYAGLYERLL
jgi:hypothetical protein